MDLIITSILEPILTAVIPVIGAAIATLIGFLIRWIARKMKLETMEKDYTILYQMADIAVKSVAQTLADDMKSDGPLTEDQKQTLKRIAEERLRAMVPDRILKTMAGNSIGIASLLDSLIEASVQDSKGEK